MRIKWRPPAQRMSATQVQLLDRLYGAIALVRKGKALAATKKARSILQLCEAWDDDEDAQLQRDYGAV